jgi:hypothetical protein
MKSAHNIVRQRPTIVYIQEWVFGFDIVYLVATSVGIYLIRTGYLKLGISNKNAARAFSSSTVRYS